MNLQELTKEHGTPLYVTNLDTVSSRYERLDESLDAFTVKYASKANFDPLVVQRLAKKNCEFVAGSSFEAIYLKDNGIDPSSLQVTAVSPKDGSLQHLVSLSRDSSDFTVTINEYDTVQRLIDRGFRGRVLVRLKPDRSLQSSSKYSNGSLLKFGMTDTEIHKTVDSVQDSGDMTLAGFHSHLGGSFLTKNIESFCKHADYTIEKSKDYVDIDSIDVINFGGGLGIPYRNSQDSLDLDLLNRKLKNRISDYDMEYVIEPGRFIVAPSTLLLTKVQVTRQEEDGRFVGVDAGMSEFARTTMFDVHHEIENVTGNNDVCSQTVAGPTCSGADIFCHGRSFDKAEIGDILSIGDVGAYGSVMSSNFHAYPSPKIVDDKGSLSPLSDGI